MDGNGGIFSFGELPEELQHQLQKELDQRQMVGEALRHDVQRLFEELSKDHLITLRLLLHRVSSDESGRYAAYLEGLASAALSFKHNVCGGCGKDHTAELLPPASEPEEKMPTVDDILAMGEESIRRHHPGLAEELGLTQLGNTPREVSGTELQDQLELPILDFDFEAVAAEYNVEFTTDDRTGTGPVKCKNCGVESVSLDDRVLREPEVKGCETCQHKAKWG